MNVLRLFRGPLFQIVGAAVAALATVVSGRAQEKEAQRLSAGDLAEMHQLIKPHAGESRWMEIDWYPNIWEARQKAAAEGKPLFLWAGSGGAPAAGC